MIKNHLKPLRGERGWSQSTLGDHLGVSRQTINAIEAGRYDPSLPLAFKISRLFNLPIESIFEDGESHLLPISLNTYPCGKAPIR